MLMLLQSVIGGWGDEKASTSQGSGLSSNEARQRQARATNGELDVGEKATHNGPHPASHRAGRKAKRPQLKRLQHDDPFEGVDMQALDDIRPEEVAVS